MSNWNTIIWIIYGNIALLLKNRYNMICFACILKLHIPISVVEYVGRVTVFFIESNKNIKCQNIVTRLTSRILGRKMAFDGISVIRITTIIKLN